MNPAFGTSFGLALMLLALGHICLHHFLAKEQPEEALSLRTALFPWPKGGRVVAGFAILAAVFFLVMSLKVAGGGSHSYKAVFVLLLFSSPLVAHLAWVLSCCKRQGTVWLFFPRSPSQMAMRWALVIPAAVAAVSLLFGLRR